MGHLRPGLSIKTPRAVARQRTFVARLAYAPISAQSFRKRLDQRFPNFDQVRSDNLERQQRHEDESELRRAREDVERQKRYLQRREFEDQMARARREAAAR